MARTTTTQIQSLADAIAAAIPHRGPRCGVALLNLPAADRDALDQALATPTIPASAISRGLAACGHELPALTIQRHRRGDCSCPR